MDVMELRRRLMMQMAQGAEYVKGSFTVPDADPYIIQFGKTFTSYLLMIEMSNESQAALQSTGTTNLASIRYIGMYPAAAIGSNTLQNAAIGFTYRPSDGNNSTANLGVTALTGSSVTIPTKSVTTSGTIRLIKGYTYNYVVVSLDQI